MILRIRAKADELQERAAVDDPRFDRGIGEVRGQAFDGEPPIEVNLHRHGTVPEQAIAKSEAEGLDRLKPVREDSINEVLFRVHTQYRYLCS